MCGIAGYASNGPAVTIDQMRVLDALRHRGPDGAGTAEHVGESRRWWLGHTRLAINDLSPAGAQPMWSANGRYAMSFNGEIYNYPELRRYCEAKGRVFASHMDGEVILHLFEMEGLASFAKLNGIFAVAVADNQSGDVVLVRDPLGVKPLFYSVTSDVVYFASELRALAALGAPLGGYDVTGLAQFLTFLWIPAPHTPFTGARSLLPGQALVWHRDEHQLVRFAYQPANSGAGDDSGLVPEARRRVAEASTRQLLSDVPVGLMASGGIDSGILWALTSDTLDRAFTVTWPEDADEKLHEDAERVAVLHERFGTPLEQIPGEEEAARELPRSGDLFADPAYGLARLIARRARESGVPVLLSGQGGDELFAGYRRHAAARWLDRWAGRWPAARVAGVLGRVGGGGVRSEYAVRLARALETGDLFSGYLQLSSYSTAVDRARVLGTSEAEVSDERVWSTHRQVYDDQPAGTSFLRRAMAMDRAVYLPGLGLAYNDRASMEYGVEVRVPWLDLDLVEWSLGLAETALLRGRQGKWVTRRVADELIGSRIARAPKRGFAAPRSAVAGRGSTGARGFRQGEYFANATALLTAYQQTVGADLLRHLTR